MTVEHENCRHSPSHKIGADRDGPHRPGRSISAANHGDASYQVLRSADIGEFATWVFVKWNFSNLSAETENVDSFQESAQNLNVTGI